MHHPPVLCAPPAPRPLGAVTETGGAPARAGPAGVPQVAFPPRGAPGDGCAGAGGGARMPAGGPAAQVTATLPVTAGTAWQGNDGPAGTGDPAGSSGGAAVTGPAGDGGARDARTPVSSRTYPLADRPLAGRAGLAGQGYVRARFGGVPVLIAPELAAQIRAVREEQP